MDKLIKKGVDGERDVQEEGSECRDRQKKGQTMDGKAARERSEWVERKRGRMNGVDRETGRE